MLTKIAAVSYNPSARSRLWEQFLSGVFEGDQAMIDFTQRAIGYSLTGMVSEPAFFIPWGGGRNGKSTLMNAVAKVMGDYSGATSKETFLRKERTGGIPNDLAKLAGVRMVLTSETEHGERLNISLIKQVTGGDVVSARFLNQEWFDFQPQMKIWMATNNKPEIPEGSKAIWERVKLIPFRADFSGGRGDKDMPEKLKAAGAAILAWAVAGCMQWQGQGLNAPEKVRAATQDYQNEQNILADFLDERCQLSKELRAQSGVLYNAYTVWATGNHERPLSNQDFARQLEQHGLTKKKSNGKMVWLGIGLAAEEQANGYHPSPRPDYARVVNDDYAGPDQDDIPF